MQTMFLFFLMLFPIAAGTGISCENPNGTRNSSHWWQCDDGQFLSIQNATIANPSGVYEYPVFLNAALKFSTQIRNKDARNNLLTDFLISVYDGWTECSWQPVPTLGFFFSEWINKYWFKKYFSANIDCKHGTSCPLPSGDSWATQNVDFSQYVTVFNALKHNKTYQIQMTVKDHDSGDTPIMCLMMQFVSRLH